MYCTPVSMSGVLVLPKDLLLCDGPVWLHDLAMAFDRFNNLWQSIMTAWHNKQLLPQTREISSIYLNFPKSL